MKTRPRTIAYCMESVARTAHQATGAWPITCPPFTANDFPIKLFRHADVIWLGLHGVETNPDYLYGDEVPIMAGLPMRIRALSVVSLTDVNLTDKVVFATTCYLQKTNFPDAFKRQGAIVIGGPGENYGDTTRLVGADKLGAALLAMLRTGLDAARALDEAKLVLSGTQADVDAMEFGIL